MCVNARAPANLMSFIFALSALTTWKTWAAVRLHVCHTVLSAIEFALVHLLVVRPRPAPKGRQRVGARSALLVLLSRALIARLYIATSCCSEIVCTQYVNGTAQAEYRAQYAGTLNLCIFICNCAFAWTVALWSTASQLQTCAVQPGVCGATQKGTHGACHLNSTTTSPYPDIAHMARILLAGTAALQRRTSWGHLMFCCCSNTPLGICTHESRCRRQESRRTSTNNRSCVPGLCRRQCAS